MSARFRLRPLPDDLGPEIAATVEEMLDTAPDRSRRGWRQRLGTVSTRGQYTCLNMLLTPEERAALLSWARGHGYTITGLLRAGVTALLDAHEVSPEEVPLSWRR